MNLFLLQMFLVLGLSSIGYAGLTPQYSLKPSSSKRLIKLDEAIQKALTNNEDFLISGKTIDAEKGRKLQAISTLLPQLRLVGSYSQQWPAISNIENGQLTGLLQGSIPIFDLSNIGKVHNATPAVNQTKLINQRAKATLIKDVSQSYLFAVSSQKVADLARNRVEKLKADELSHIKKLEAGRIRKLDAQRASLLVLEAQNQLEVALVTNNHAIAFLGYLIGEHEHFVIEESKHIDAIEDHYEANALVSLAQNDRLDLKAQKIGAKIAQQNHRIDWFGFFPKLDFTGSLGIGMPQSFVPTILLNASIPIFEGGVQFGRLKTSKALMAQENLKLMQLSRKVDAEVRGAIDEINLKKIALKLAQESHQLSEAMNLSATKLFELGQASGLEWSEANRNLYAAQVEVEKALLALDESRLNLKYLSESIG